MKRILTFSTGAMLMCGTAAQADVTAQQVWDNWSEQMAIYGPWFTTGEQTMAGDTLTVADVRIEMSDDEASVLAELGDIQLTENGDGTVTVTTADSYPITIDSTLDYGETSTVNVTVRQEGMNLVVSGEPDAMIYDVAAALYAIQIDSIEGAAGEDITLSDAVVALRDLSGTYSVIDDNLKRITYELAVGAVDMDVLFTQTGGEGVVNFNGDIADLGMFANIATPIDMDMEAEMPPFNEGLSFDGGYTFGDVRYVFDFNVDGEAGSGSAEVGSGALNFAMDMDDLVYSGGSKDVAVSVLMPNEIPFPLEASMAAYGFDFRVPLSQGEGGPRDARLAFNITELAISDILWNLGDPQNILPREPVTLALGLDVQVTPFFDLLDPAQQEALMMTDVPGELNGVELTELTVRAAGAEITGDGAFTFDNTDLDTFDGFPRPEGELNLAINGVNGLVDRLIQMGIVPEEQAMMPRMMLGMFATPVGDDMLTSKIEVNSEGHVLANGQRLR